MCQNKSGKDSEQYQFIMSDRLEFDVKKDVKYILSLWIKLTIFIGHG